MILGELDLDPVERRIDDPPYVFREEALGVRLRQAVREQLVRSNEVAVADGQVARPVIVAEGAKRLVPTYELETPLAHADATGLFDLAEVDRRKGLQIGGRFGLPTSE